MLFGVQKKLLTNLELGTQLPAEGQFFSRKPTFCTYLSVGVDFGGRGGYVRLVLTLLTNEGEGRGELVWLGMPKCVEGKRFWICSGPFICPTT